MFFALSKILFFLIDPLTWILILVIWGFFAKSKIVKKRIYLVTIVLLLLFTNPFLFNQVSLKWQPKWNEIKDSNKYTVGILLGGMSYYDKNDRGYFGTPADRFIQTANLYHEKKIDKILITGGSGNFFINEPDESTFLANEFIRNGIDKDDLLLEKKSRNTYENAIFSKKILDSLQIRPPYLLITSTQHMPRSVMVFRKAGYNNFATYPCDFREFEKKFELKSIIIPELRLIGDWKTLIKEWVGILAYKLTGKA